MNSVIAWGVLALVIDVVLLGPGRVLSLVGPIVMIAVLTGVVTVLAGAPDRTSWRRAFEWWVRVTASAASLVLCLALAGVIAPLLSLGVLAVFGLSTPVVSDRIRVWWSGSVAANEPGGTAGLGLRWRVDLSGGTATETQVRPADLTTIELCQVWRATFWTVRGARDPGLTLRVVWLRGEVLDELEMRHPSAVREWMHANGSVADGPARYL